MILKVHLLNNEVIEFKVEDKQAAISLAKQILAEGCDTSKSNKQLKTIYFYPPSQVAKIEFRLESK